MSGSVEEISASRRRACIILIAVASLFTLLHLFINTLHLVDRELWLDEASTYGVAAHSFWRNFSLPTLFVAMASVVVAYLPYLTAAYVWQGHSGSGHPTWIGAWHAMTAAPYAETLKSFLPLGYPYSFVLWGLLLVVVCVDLAQRRSDFVLWTMLIIGQIAFVHGFLFGRSFIVNRYYTPAYPALLYLFALGVHRTWTATRRYWWVAPATLAFLVWDSYAPFAASARAPLGGGRWRALHQALSAVPGRKVVFFDVGYNGQMLEYEARHDADIVLAQQKGTFWAAGGDNHLDPEYIEATIAREAPTTRCFYYVLEQSPGPYSDVFLPAMRRLGYREAPSPGQSVNGFCKP